MEVCNLRSKLKGQHVVTLSKIVLSLMVVAMATSAQAAVTLVTPEEIPVLALDQQEVNGSFFRSSKTSYKLDPGTHEIAVRYEQLFNLTNGDHDVLKSAVVSVRANLEDNKTYRLSLVNPPKNYDVAKDYVKQPIIAVLDEQGKVIAQQQGLDNAPKPMLGSSFFNRVMDFRNKPEMQKDLTTSQTDNNSQAVTSSVKVSTVSTTGANDNLEQLKQLWQNASKQEREQFMQFIIR
ncbi:DUF2057 domain-containing protein [Alkanindiges illinoisensis]|uniref:DUF2057 domain-containing protein n=1 Tax=Alkanindiges illinoisensis TaxID=197183 RepID=A0A4Y7X8L6_9GAMM|nr:DUF2057 domain-containing protein [Alkanindiges illinoisensis]